MTIGINFRATSGYVTDGAGETYCLGEAYPVTRGGYTFGFSTDLTGNARDRDASNDRRLAGCVFQVNTAGTADFILDLPAAGDYRIRAAFGDAGSLQYQLVVLKDGTTTLATIDDYTGVDEYEDITGAHYFSDTAWASSNVSADHTFAGTQLILTIGNHSSGTYSTSIAHLYVEPLNVTPTIAPAGLSSDEAFGTATLTRTGPINISATGIPSAESFGAPTVTGTSQILTSVLVNNTGTPQTSTAVHWSWFPAGRIGSMESVTQVDGSGTTDANGQLAVAVAPPGVLLVAIRATGATDDAVYYEAFE